MKVKIEKDGYDSLSIEHKEEIHVFHKSMDLLMDSIFNNNKFKLDIEQLRHVF